MGAGDDSGSFYGSSSWDDDYCLAAGLLYKATKEEMYKSEYDANKASLADRCSQPFGWDNAYQAAVLYAPQSDAAALNKLGDYLDGYVSKSQNSYYCHDQWGSARINCNIQLIMQILDKYEQTSKYQSWCREQMSMILGNNPQKINLVCGYNDRSPKKPHHRAASGYDGWDGFNANADQKYILFGALVGGPSGSDFSTYQDTVGDAVCNEVTLDYNAGMIGAAAALYLQHTGSKQSGYKKQTLLADFYGGKNWSDPTYATDLKSKTGTDISKPGQTGQQTNQQISVKKTTLKKVKKTGNKVKVSWKKNEGVDGYELQAAQNKKFSKGVKTKKVKASKTSAVIKKKYKKACFVRIRAYQKDANGAIVYGKWSKKKRAK